jgi:hypothetical protein
MVNYLGMYSYYVLMYVDSVRSSAAYVVVGLRSTPYAYGDELHTTL